MSGAGNGTSNYGFTNEYTSQGLIYLRARTYSPYLKQFIQADPIVPNPYKPWQWNHYTYSRNNPVNYTDPSGMCAQGDQPCLKAAQRLFEDYGWYFVGQWQIAEIELLRDAAKEIAGFFDNHGGNGQARMRGAISPVWFSRGGLFWNWLGRHHVVAREVYLVSPFSIGNIIHESAHALDNLTGSSIYASIFGGGPSDDMARSLGMDPTRCTLRFSCSKYIDMLRDAKSEPPPTDYGLHGPSEDFADSFMLLISNDATMRQKAPIRSNWITNYIEHETRTRSAYEGNPYQYLWFTRQPIPIPECSIPKALTTPQP
jgi:RHS repeat-associated protein